MAELSGVGSAKVVDLISAMIAHAEKHVHGRSAIKSVKYFVPRETLFAIYLAVIQGSHA